MMSATIFRNAKLHVTDKRFAGVTDFAVQDHRVIPADPMLLENTSTEEIDLNGMHVCPGFIDLLVNGCAGESFTNSPSIFSLEAIRAYMLQNGTTTFVPTLLSSSYEMMQKAFNTIRAFKENHALVCPGIHLEGPFINILFKGFQPENYIRPISEADIITILQNRDEIAYMTIAPELVRPKNIISLLRGNIRLAVSHSAASYFEALSAFKAGIGMVTHMYNGMRPIMGRDPGIIGAALECDHVMLGMIPDGRHIHPSVIKLMHNLLGDRLYIVSDSQTPAGTNKDRGSFSVAGTEVFIDQRRGMIDSKGSLAGTGITMFDGVRYLVKHCSFTLDEALYAATQAPAKCLGLTEIGIIAPGSIADLVIFDDNFKIKYVLQNGYIKNIGDVL